MSTCVVLAKAEKKQKPVDGFLTSVYESNNNTDDESEMCWASNFGEKREEFGSSFFDGNRSRFFGLSFLHNVWLSTYKERTFCFVFVVLYIKLSFYKLLPKKKTTA